MEISEELVAKLGTALNESSIAGMEYSKKKNAVAVTFSVLTLPESGLEPKDPRRQFVFYNIGRIAASLRHGNWDDDGAPVETFEIENLLVVVQSFGCQSIYGWQFFNVHEDEMKQWGNRLSLDLKMEKGSMDNSISLFQEGISGKRHLDICIWFEYFRILDAQYNEISQDDFIAGGIRWWNAMYSGDQRTANHGIYPLKGD